MIISVCIPMYNESAIIEKNASILQSYMTKRFGKDNFEVIFFDDGSKDNSFDLVSNLKLDNVRILRTVENHGKGSAVRRAMLAANGDIAMFTDADLAYGCDVIGEFADYMNKNPDTDVLIGSRSLHKDGYEGYTLMRKIASKLYITVLCVLGGFKLSDSQCGCKAFSGKAAKRVFSNCTVNRFAFDFEAILIAEKCGYKIKEIPVKVINHGDSKVNVLRDSFKMIRDILKMKKRIKKLDV